MSTTVSATAIEALPDDFHTNSQQDNQDEYQQCAICQISADDSSNLLTQSGAQSLLFTNAAINCGHQFCNSCVERELSRRKAFPCPYCQTLVKRATLSTRTLDDVQCEKDTSWRRRVLKVFNKVESDFATLQDFNDYLESVEDIIFSIVNEEPDAEDCKAKLKKYEEENKSAIVIRQSQRADEDRCIADRIASEQRDAERRKRENYEEEQEVRKVKLRIKKEQQQVMLGEREEVSAELLAIQRLGFRNEIRRQQKSRRANEATKHMSVEGPRVREPQGGLVREKNITRELYEKRVNAGAGVTSGSIAVHERNWNEAVASLFCF